MLFTSPRDELSCQKLISPPDPNQFRGLCKIQPSGWHIKHQAWEKTARWRGIYRRFFFFFFFYVAASHYRMSLSQQGFWETSTLACSKARKWNGLSLCWLYAHTRTHTRSDAGMHAGQLRHVCSCSLIAPCQVREIWETRSHQSGPDLSNETFLLQRSVTDMNDE